MIDQVSLPQVNENEAAVEDKASTSVKGKHYRFLSIFQVLIYIAIIFALSMCHLPTLGDNLPEAIYALHVRYCKEVMESGRCTC